MSSASVPGLTSLESEVLRLSPDVGGLCVFKICITTTYMYAVHTDKQYFRQLVGIF